MQLDDMIMVSVDDHVVEPPDMFERHLPRKWRDVAPARRTTRRRQRRVGLRRQRDPEHRAQRRRRPPARRVRHGADVVRGDPLGLLRHRRPRPRHGRERRARFDVLPVVPEPVRAALQPLDGQDAGLAVLQAYNDWHIDEWCGSAPGPVHPADAPADLGSGRDGGRGAAHRGEGLPRGLVLGEPGAAEAAELPRRALGPVLAGLRRTRARSSACTSARRRAWS